MASQPQTFDQSLAVYRTAQVTAGAQMDDARDTALAAVDDALDALLAAPSLSIGDFADKLRALADEYGCDWQPRHVRSLIADLAVFAS